MTPTPRTTETAQAEADAMRACQAILDTLPIEQRVKVAAWLHDAYRGAQGA